MSIELQKAKEKLDVLEKIRDNPDLILTDLFTGREEDIFLWQVNVDGKMFSQFLIECLSSIDMFNDPALTIAAFALPEIDISTFGLYSHGYNESWAKGQDKILSINTEKKTYKLHDARIRYYMDIISKEYEMSVYDLDDFWKRYENFTFKKRAREVFRCLRKDRMRDCIYLLTISKKKTDAMVEEQRRKVTEKNERSRKFFNEKIEMQNYYKEQAPEHINFMRTKQMEISAYLNSIGYTEEPESAGRCVEWGQLIL